MVSYHHVQHDGRMDGHTDGQMDESDFIWQCPTNVKRPIEGAVSLFYKSNKRSLQKISSLKFQHYSTRFQTYSTCFNTLHTQKHQWQILCYDLTVCNIVVMFDAFDYFP